MYQHLRLGQGAVDQQLAGPLPRCRLGLVERQAKRMLHVPLGEQFHFPAQQCLVIAGQRCAHGQRLQGQQGINGIGEQGIGVVGADDVQVGVAAQIAQ